MATTTQGWNVLANAYFLNYEKAVYPSASNIYYNTFNFVVDHQYLKNTKNTSTPVYTETITFSTNSASSLFTNMVYNFNVTPPTNNSSALPFFKITLNRTGTPSKSIVCPVHDDFTSLVYSYINKTDSEQLFNNTFVNWHIVVICSLDVCIIVALFKDMSKQINKIFMTQTYLKDGNPIYVQYLGNSSGQLLKTTGATTDVTTSALMVNHYNNFTNVCPNTVVPNLAMVAKNLGYVV
jgi:hypothetical protein